MWEPLAEVLVKDHTVIIPDLRGMGLSCHPESGDEKTAQAKNVAGILEHLKLIFARPFHFYGATVRLCYGQERQESAFGEMTSCKCWRRNLCTISTCVDLGRD